MSKGRFSILLFVLVLVMYTGFQIMYTPVHMQVCPDPQQLPAFYQHNEDNNVTIVTMYLNIGTLQKTSFWIFSHTSYTTDTYKEWLMSWGKLTNKVIAFFDDDEFISQFRLLRAHLPSSYTKIVKISRDQLPAFQKMQRVQEILDNPTFRVSYPAAYTCTMNAKYDALEKVLSMEDVQSEYLAWMDIGLFRRLKPSHPQFSLQIPPGFNSSMIGVSEVTPRGKVSKFHPRQIFEQNIVWVAGGYILAHRKILPTFIKEYRMTVEELLKQDLADTDQQVLTSMYSPMMVAHRTVWLRPYGCPRGSFGLFGHGYLYFCLPYICKESAECKTRTISSGKHAVA